MDFMFHLNSGGEWPEECERKYLRLEGLGKGSFGMVWMSRRVGSPENDDDDEFVAIKCIDIKNEKCKVYAEREIRILHEMKHPNVIRLIKDYPLFANTRVVVMQLARGPNLHELAVHRGALGLPLSRFVSRQLIAAVAYIHGRAVIHRDIKPSNCILSLTEKNRDVNYDWYLDDAIWSNKENGVKAVQSGKWRLMLVDFGFARALDKEELEIQSKHLRNSILFENHASQSKTTSEPKPQQHVSTSYTPRSMYPPAIPEAESSQQADDDSIEADMEALESMVEEAAKGLRKSFLNTRETEEALLSGEALKRLSDVSMPVKPRSSRLHLRSLSALGTKAFAAPEIRKELRHKNEDDFTKNNAAMTECVADYGMSVDAYSVGLTLRVVMTGVPPNYTLSEYAFERAAIIMLSEDDEEEDKDENGSLCCCLSPLKTQFIRVRDPSMLPKQATLLLTQLTVKKPENRMTVREAQLDPWIAGGMNDDDPPYTLPIGDTPSHHGDPVVPLDCAAELSRLTVQYHMQ